MSFLSRLRNRGDSNASANPPPPPEHAPAQQCASTATPATAAAAPQALQPSACARCADLERRIREAEQRMSAISATHTSPPLPTAAAAATMSGPTPQAAARLRELETEALQLRDTVQQLMDEVGSRDRAIKRNESVAKDTIRAKERQIVQQSTQLAELQDKLSQREENVRVLEEQLQRERARVATVQDRALHGEEASSSLQQSALAQLQQRDLVIHDLEKSLAEWKRTSDEYKRKVSAAEEKRISLGSELESKDALIASLREALESERRVALLRNQQQAAVAAAAAATAVPVTGASASTVSAAAHGGSNSAPAAVASRTAVAGAGAANHTDPSSTSSSGGNAAGRDSAPPNLSTAGSDNQFPASGASLSSPSQSGAVATPTSPSSPLVEAHVREMLNLENLLKAKDKQVIRLSNDLVKVRAELSSKELTVTQLQEEKNILEATAASMKTALDETRRQLDSTANELSRRTMQIAELRNSKGARDEEFTDLVERHSALQREVADLRSQEDAYRSFRVQHVDCQARMVDKDLQLFEATTALTEIRRLLDKAYNDNEALTQQVATYKDRCDRTSGQSSVEASKYEARLASLEHQLAERKRCVEELESKLAEKTSLHSDAVAELGSVRVVLEEEREAWRTKTQRSDDAIAQLQQSLQRTIAQHATRENELQARVDKLQQEVQQVLQAKREQDVHLLHLQETLRREQQTKIAVTLSPHEGELLSPNAVVVRSPLSAGSPSGGSPSGGSGPTSTTTTLTTAAAAPGGGSNEGDRCNGSRVTASNNTGPSSSENVDVQGGENLSPTGETRSRSSTGGGDGAGLPPPALRTGPKPTSSTATTSLQRVSLELEELRQKYSKLQRDYDAKERELSEVARRLREAEASGAGGGDGTQSNITERRLVGMLESLSVEVANQLASHLRIDYMRFGVVTTLNAITNGFHLGRVEALELMDALSRMMIMVRCKVPLPKICERLGVQENSIRRILHAFSKTGPEGTTSLPGGSSGSTVNTSRHQLLLSQSPAEACFTFSGSERLQLLLCANSHVLVHRRRKAKPSRAADLDDDELGEGGTTEDVDDDIPCDPRCPIQRLSSDPFLLGLISTYLPIVIRGNTAFAAHVKTRRSSGSDSGQTLLLSVEPADGSFSLMECEVTAARCIVVLVSGVFKSAFSWQTCSHVKVQMQCKTKQDGVLVAGSGSWKWSSVEKIPRDEQSVLQYLIKSDGLAEGLVAETQGARLRELSVAEVMMIQELYSGELPTATAMLEHRSWDIIPPPAPARGVGRSGTGGPSAGRK